MKLSNGIMIAIALLAMTYSAYGEDIVTNGGNEEAVTTTLEKVEALENRIKELESVSKIGFDLGFGVEHYRDGYISEATIGGDGNVRITDEYDIQPSLWLQFSWLSDKTFFGFGGDKCESICTGGVFTGVRLGGQNASAMDAFSVGIVLASFQVGYGDKSQKSNVSRFYIGYGPVVHRTRAFADGISEGNPLPSGLTEITYRKSYQASHMLMLGVRF